jgi:transcriptional regulator with XRE-family HTH domain
VGLLTDLVIFTKYNSRGSDLAMLFAMVTSRQIRAGRALLGWTQTMLADRALVAINTVRAIEQDRPYPKEDTVQAVEHALRKAGVVFLSEGPLGEGVRLAKPRSVRTR